MDRKKLYIKRLSGCLAILLGLLICSESTLALAQQYRPRRVGTPKRREGAGTRGTCLAGQRSLMPLSPIDSFAATVSDRPTLFWYIPPKALDALPSAARTAELRLLDENYEELYTTQFDLSGYSGIVSFTFPNPELLEVGREYVWQFSVICDPTVPSKNPFVEGRIQRIPLDQTLDDRLQIVPPRERPSLYASEGIWQDSLTTLADLRCARPGDFGLSLSWANLLNSVGLRDFAGESLGQYCNRVAGSQPSQNSGGSSLLTP